METRLKSVSVLFVCASEGVCAYGSMELLGGRLPLDSSWSHMGRRWQLWSLSGCAEDICHTGHPLPPVCNNPPRRLQGGAQQCRAQIRMMCKEAAAPNR